MVVAGLTVQQGQTIESQRNMIRTLFMDSKELSALKIHDDQQKRATEADNQVSHQEKAEAKSNCADSKDKSTKGCDVPQAATPSRPSGKNTVPEKSDDGNSMPNPQRLLHSI